MSRVLCIYHGGCPDGFGAAYAVWKALGDAVEFFPATHGDAPPDVTGREVLIVDFSYRRAVLEEMGRSAMVITILDHHKTAQDDLAAFAILKPATYRNIDAVLRVTQPGLGNIRAAFDMDRSGAMMAWQFFHAGPPPELIRYIQDRDLWTRSLPGSDEFMVALQSYPQDFAVWDELTVPRLIEEGRHIHRYYRGRVEDAKAKAFRAEIGGYIVPVVNASGWLASDVAGELSEGEPFAALYYDEGEWRNYSLRSRGDGIDVSEIARRYGGGGHRNAAGFRLPRPA